MTPLTTSELSKRFMRLALFHWRTADCRFLLGDIERNTLQAVSATKRALTITRLISTPDTDGGPSPDPRVRGKIELHCSPAMLWMKCRIQDLTLIVIVSHIIASMSLQWILIFMAAPSVFC